jgi:hypothetical protein
LARQWPDVPSEGKLPPHKEPPYDFALVSLRPAIYVLWPRQMELNFGAGVGDFSLYPVADAHCVSTLPPVKELMWFSADLRAGPAAVAMADEGHGEIAWKDGKILLTRTAAGWVTERQ